MAQNKVIPQGQTFVDLRDGRQVSVTRHKASSSTDYVVFPNPIHDASILGETEAQFASVQFYLGGGSKGNILNIDGMTSGDEAIIVTRHGGMVNFGSE